MRLANILIDIEISTLEYRNRVRHVNISVGGGANSKRLLGQLSAQAREAAVEYLCKRCCYCVREAAASAAAARWRSSKRAALTFVVQVAAQCFPSPD